MNIEIIVVICIAVAGWIATHWLTIRAQNKTFVNQLLNEARIQITKAIRDYQDWLGSVYGALYVVSSDIAIQEHFAHLDQVTQQNVNPIQRDLKKAENWLQKRDQLSRLFFKRADAHEWIFRLEEYEVLFPETADCIRDLADREDQIIEFLQSFLEKVPSGFEKSSELEECKKAIEGAQENAELILNQQILMQDLLIYLQNLSLGSLTGNKIPERTAMRPYPKLIQDKAGNLRLVITPSSTEEGKD